MSLPIHSIFFNIDARMSCVYTYLENVEFVQIEFPHVTLSLIDDVSPIYPGMILFKNNISQWSMLFVYLWTLNNLLNTENWTILLEESEVCLRYETSKTVNVAYYQIELWVCVWLTKCMDREEFISCKKAMIQDLW